MQFEKFEPQKLSKGTGKVVINNHTTKLINDICRKILKKSYHSPRKISTECLIIVFLQQLKDE